MIVSNIYLGMLKFRLDSKKEGLYEGRLQGRIRTRQDDIIECLKQKELLDEELTNAIYSQDDIIILKSWLRIALESKSKEEAAEIVVLNKVIIEENIAEAVKEGKRIGKAELVIIMLNAKFKGLSDNYKNKLMTLPEKTIYEIGMQIFEIESIEELDKYL